ncbi:MAG: hypothetical protein NXY59_08225 [Aigarchaeota archaeon]|nr:hypothetical protein [Candidatus Pelearchaeum maunauluense]
MQYSKHILTATLLFALITVAQPTAYAEKLWFIGYGGIMLPLLDGAEIDTNTGEEIWIKIVGGDGEITIESPNGETHIITLKDGETTLLKRFSPEDKPGTWNLTTDDGKKMRIILREPEKEETELITSITDDKRIKLRIESKSGTGFIISNKTITKTYPPGGLITFELEPPVFYQYKIDLIRDEPPAQIAGKIENTTYRLEFEHLVASYIAKPSIRENGWELRIQLPEINKVGPSGIFPLRYGKYIIRISQYTETKTEELFREKIAILPKEITKLPLTTEMEMSIEEALKNPITLILVSTNEEVSRIEVKTPIAQLKVIDKKHNKTITDFQIPATKTRITNINGTNYIIFQTQLTITNREAIIEPTRTIETAIKINGFSTTEYIPKPLTFRAGEEITIITNLHQLNINLIYPDGKTYNNKVKITIDGTEREGNGSIKLLLPTGEYEIRSIEPPGFNPTRITLNNDKNIEIIIVKQTTELAILRAAAILLAAILTSLIYRRLAASRSNKHLHKSFATNKTSTFSTLKNKIFSKIF